MTSIANNPAARIAAIAVGLVLAFSAFAPVAQAAALTNDQVNAIITMIQSFGADAATVANVRASLTGGTPTTGGGTTTGGTSACTFTRDLTVGATGADVTCLQSVLISKGYSIPAGATGYFGSQTVAAVKAWQTASAITPVAGYFGPKSRAAFAAMGGTTTPTTPTVPAGTGLSVMAGTQPANSLAPQGATRVPFTRFVVTAGNDGDVVINSVVVQRTGLGSDAAFGGVVLIDDSTGKQLGTAKTFNSNHQATVGEAITIPRGTSKTFLVAGNMAASLASYAGEAPALSVISINTTATVSGSLPITGAYHTTNATLTVGALTMAASNSNAANSASTTKEIGTTAFKASGFRLTASSAEDVRVRSIRMNQIGSVGSGDISNVMINVGGTAYPATVSADGKYYEAVLGSGVVIGKGNNVEVYTQYDIIGGSSRTIIFHVDKSTDVYATGETYGYGATTSGGNTNNPFYFGQQVTVSGATVTTIQKSNAVPAQNIAPNVPNQPLGAFETDIKGEAISVQSTVFNIATTAGVPQLTNVTVVDENGSVVAGPVDSVYVSSGASTLTFTDTITFKTGKHTYTLRGKISNTSGTTNGATVAISTTPSSGWTTVKGETTGNTISLSANGVFSMNTMTLKTGAMAVTRGTTPSSKTIIAGASNFEFVTLQFDASQSGEDVRFSSIPLSLAYSGSANNSGTDINNCQVYDGATSISDSPINPSSATTSSYTATATLSNPVTVAKGTVKTLGIRCNVGTAAVSGGGYAWDHGTIGNFSFTGMSSAQTVSGTAPSDTTVIMSVGTGAMSVSTDSSSPAYKLVAAGSTDVLAGAYRITTGNEAVSLTELALALTSYASSSISDIVKGSIYDGSTKIGDIYFTSDGGPAANSIATSTFTSALALAANSDKVLTLKLDLGTIGNNAAATSSGKFITINFNALKGVGVDSGSTYDNGDTTGSTAVSGIRMMRSFPLVAQDTSLASTGLVDGRLGRFKVTADSHGAVGLTEFNFKFATTTTLGLSGVNVYAYIDSSYSQPVSGLASNGAVSLYSMPVGCTVECTGFKTTATNFELTFTDTSGASTTLQIPANTTYYFEVRGTVTNVTSGSSVVTTLVGDSAASFSGLDGIEAGRLSNTLGSTTAEALSTVGKAAFIWSPNSTTTATRGHDDWTNGYGVQGLGSNGLIMTRSQ